MWNKRSFLLLINARVRTKGSRRLWVCVAVSIFPLELLLLSLDVVLGILPGRVGKAANGALNVVHGIFLSIMNAEPQTFVNAQIEARDALVSARIRTVGLRSGEPTEKSRLALPYGSSLLGRLAALLLGLFVTTWIFQAPFGNTLPAALVALLFYALIRPVFLVLALPFNMLLFGLATLFVDALMLKWACGFFAGFPLNYWECMLASAFTGLFYMPFAYWKRRSVPIKYAL